MQGLDQTSVTAVGSNSQAETDGINFNISASASDDSHNESGSDDGHNSDNLQDDDISDEYDEEDDETVNHQQQLQQYNENQDMLMLTPEAQRLTIAMLCYYDFIVGRLHTYISDVTVMFEISEFLTKQQTLSPAVAAATAVATTSAAKTQESKSVSDFLTYVLNYTCFLSAEVCNFFIKFGCDPELVLAKNKDYLNDETKTLSDKQLKMAKLTLDLYMRNEESLPSGNNFNMFKKLKLNNREKLIIVQRAGKSIHRITYLELLAGDTLSVADSTDQHLLNDYQLDYMFKKFKPSQYINYVAVNISDRIPNALIDTIPFDIWLKTSADSPTPAPVHISSLVDNKSYSKRLVLLAYKEHLLADQKKVVVISPKSSK